LPSLTIIQDNDARRRRAQPLVPTLPEREDRTSGAEGFVRRRLQAAHGRAFVSLRRHRNFRLMWIGLVFSHVGSWMQQTALAWFVLDLTGSAVAVGLLAFFRFAPFTVFGLFAGVLTDRVDTRRLLIVTQSASMLVAVVLAALAFSGTAQVWHAYALAFLAGTAHVFDRTARTTFTVQMVGREDLPNAVALNASVFNTARILGPAVAGVLIAAVGVSWAFAVNALSFVAVLLGLFLIRVDELVPLVRTAKPPVLRGIREGLSYAMREPRIRTVLVLLVALATVGFQFHVLVPVIAAETLDAGPRTFGIISSCFGVGALAGSLLTAASGSAGLRRLFIGAIGLTAGMVVLATQDTVVAASVVLFGLGIFFVFWTASSESILQLTAPDHLRGRVMSLYMFTFGGVSPLGALLAGWLAEVGGASFALFASAAATAAVAFVAFAALRRSGYVGSRLRREAVVDGTAE
jgi:MFS family permease